MRISCAVVLVAATAAADVARPPKVVTQAWLREMNASEWPLDAMIDRRRGLIVLERRVDSADVDFKGVVSAKRFCGAELDRELRALEQRLRAEYRAADTFHCQNKPSAACSFELAYEYTTITSVGFAKADDGTLRLALVTFLDGGNQVASFFTEQARWVDAQLDKLAQLPTCDAR